MKNELLLNAMEYIDADLIEESNFGKAQKLRPRKVFTLLLVAVLTFAFAASAFAERRSEWDVDLLNYTGLSHSTTQQLESGMVEIDASDTQSVENQLTGETEEIRLTATASIGDSSNAYIKIETNMEVPEGYDVVMPDIQSMSVVKKQDNSMTEHYASQFEGMTEDGNVYFILKIEDAAHLSQDYVNLTLGDVYAYNDEEEGVLLYEGTWNLEWKYSYKSNCVVSHPYRILTIEGERILLTKIKITPLEVKAYATGLMDSEDAVYSQFEVESLTLKDGTVISFGTDGGGGLHSEGRLCYFSNYSNLDLSETVLNPKDVESVTINGVEVSIR